MWQRGYKGLPRETRCKKRRNRQEVASDSKVHIVEKTSDRCRWFWILSTVRQTKTSKSDQSLGWSYEIMCIVHQVSKINMHQKKSYNEVSTKKNIKHNDFTADVQSGLPCCRPLIQLPPDLFLGRHLAVTGCHWLFSCELLQWPGRLQPPVGSETPASYWSLQNS